MIELITGLRQRVSLAFLALVLLCSPVLASAVRQEAVLLHWYELVLKLVRHTATYSPPLASRNFAYLGVTSYEAVASGDVRLNSLAGQLNGLKPLPKREGGKAYDESVVLNAALARALSHYFSNTGPSGQNALRVNMKKMDTDVAHGVPAAVAQRSKDFGDAIADHIFEWSQADGAAKIENMGFPLHYTLGTKPGHWVPTNQQGLQQHPLLPDWGKNRTFALPSSSVCPLSAHLLYSEDKRSEFFREADEVYKTRTTLSAEQEAIARFWSDDPMLSPTPPGHWVSIYLDIAAKEKLNSPLLAEGLARLGIAVADAFIGCWHSKYEHDLLRPVTYIQKHIDPKWEPLLVTPPFPEYPSGHSVQSGAAVEVLELLFGKAYAFDDDTHVQDGIAARHFSSFEAAAQEAALSRLFGGIHFRAAIVDGLVQGRCIGGFAAKLNMAKP